MPASKRVLCANICALQICVAKMVRESHHSSPKAARAFYGPGSPFPEDYVTAIEGTVIGADSAAGITAPKLSVTPLPKLAVANYLTAPSRPRGLQRISMTKKPAARFIAFDDTATIGTFCFSRYKSDGDYPTRDSGNVNEPIKKSVSDGSACRYGIVAVRRGKALRKALIRKSTSVCAGFRGKIVEYSVAKE